MASPDPDQPADRESSASPDAIASSVSSGCADGLGLLVWLGQLARDESARRPSRCGAAELLDAPRFIGRFNLQALLGAGAYGAVFRAVDTQLGRQIALKLAWPGVLMDPVAGRRFVEEPRTVASLRHRGIVEVYDSGEIEMAAFIALELIDGPTLGQWLKEQERVRPRLASEIVRCVAEAVHYAHERGIVHRDLKPGNILLRPTADGDPFGFEPVVTDFGLARRPQVSETSMLTGTNAIIGTDHYMSPEQAAGRKHDIGPASDIFSLGVILYELVAGWRPFEGDSSEQVRRRIQESEPAPIRPWRNSVPKDLETIALKCLEKAPGRRYPSARALADDLGRFLDNRPIVARPVGVVQRAWKFAKRKPLAVSIVSLAVASLLTIASLVGAWIADRASSARRIAEAEAAATVSEGVEREHRYIANIRHAAEALRRGGRRNVLDLLDQCRRLEGGPLRRGIEWNYLDAQVNDFDRTLQAHAGDVYVVRFSPRGDILVSGGKDGRAIVWDTASWTKQQEFNDRVGDVNAVEVSPDGSLLALGGDDGRVVVHRLNDGSIVFDEPIVKGRVFDLAWLGNNAQLAVGGEDAVLTVLDLSNGQRRSTPPLDTSPPREFTDPTQPVSIAAMAYVPEQRAVAVGTKPSGIHIVDIDSLAAKSLWRDQAWRYPRFCYVPGDPGHFVFPNVVDQSGLFVSNAVDGSNVVEILAPGVVHSLRFSEAAGAIAGTYRDGTVRTWGIEAALAGRQPSGRTFCAHDGRAWTVDSAPDGAWMASGGQDGLIRLWHARLVRAPFDAPLEEHPAQAVFSPCGRWLTVVFGVRGPPGRMVLFDARTGRRLWTCKDAQPVGQPLVRSLSGQIAFDPTGAEIVVSHADGSVYGHDSQTGSVTQVYRSVAKDPVNWLQVTADGRSLLMANADAVLLVERTSGAAVQHSVDPVDTQLGVLHTSLGDLWTEHLAATRHVVLRRGVRGKPVKTLVGPFEKLTNAAVSPDGRYLAAGGIDRIIYIWDLTHDSPPTKCIGHDDGFSLLVFSPDGRTLISHSKDYSVRFWHVASGAELLKIGSRDDPVLCTGLNPAGNMLVLGVEHDGFYGLHVYRLGRHRDSLPRTFESPPADAP